MVLAVAGALALGDYTEAAAVVVLFAVATWLEEGCGRRARDAVTSVVASQPVTASLADSGELRLHMLLASMLVGISLFVEQSQEWCK